MKLMAINVLMDPDPSTAEKARAVNARLRSNFPHGFALDSDHAPHVTLVQCFVRVSNLASVAASVTAALADIPPANWTSKATGYYALAHENLGLMGIVISPTASLLGAQAQVIEAIAPYIVKHGTADAFVPNPAGGPVGQPTVDYVNAFIGPRTGENFNPHLTVGIGTRDFVEALKAEPFEPFTVSPVSVSLYQLGDFGTARRKLHELHRC